MWIQDYAAALVPLGVLIDAAALGWWILWRNGVTWSMVWRWIVGKISDDGP